MREAIAVVLIGVFMGLAAGCAIVSGGSVAQEATAENFAASSETKGAVVLSINWGRRWDCGAYENAELMRIGFDRLSIADNTDVPSQIFIDGPPRLMKKSAFLNYALLLDAGEYALTSFDIKVAASVSNGSVVSHVRDRHPLRTSEVTS